MEMETYGTVERGIASFWTRWQSVSLFPFPTICLLYMNCVFGCVISTSINLPDNQTRQPAAWQTLRLPVNFMVNDARHLCYLTFCATLIEALTIPKADLSPCPCPCHFPQPLTLWLPHVRFVYLGTDSELTRDWLTGPVLSDSVYNVC